MLALATHTRERFLQPSRGTSRRAEGLAALPRRPIATCRDGRRGCGGGRFPAIPRARRHCRAGGVGQGLRQIPFPGGFGRIPPFAAGCGASAWRGCACLQAGLLSLP